MSRRCRSRIPFGGFAAFALASLAAPAAAQLAPAPAAAAGRVVEVEVPAPSLAGNLMGTPDLQGAAVYLPPGYETSGERRYPTIYLLHGIFDTYRVWLDHYSIPHLVDRLIAAGEIPEILLVMPNGINQLGGGFYRDSPVSGNWGSYVASDLVDYVDASFRTLARPESRAIVGHSMGGYGALHLAIERPGIFSVVWAMSPCCLAPLADFGFGNDAWRRAYRFEGPDDLGAAMEAGDFYAAAAVGVLTAFSPDPGNPPFFVDFPFDLVNGEVVLDDDAYDRYLRAFPERRLADARPALKSLRGLALDAGIGDQFLHIPPGTLSLSRRLGELRIPHLLDLFDGDHRKLVDERLEALILPWIGERLEP